MSPEAATRELSPRPARHARLGMILETTSLVIILLVVAMRPLLSETYDTGVQPITAAAGAPDLVTTATTAWFDFAIWAAALAGIASVLLKRSTWRWTGVECGWLLLVVAAVISTLAAGNKRLAANASADWLTTTAMLFTIVNVCRDRWRVYLLLAVVFASGAASAGKAAMQLGWEYAEMRADYQQHRQEFWARQNVSLDDPRVELFERRMKTDQASGFFAHSNTEAGLLCLTGFAGLALAAGASRRPACLGIVLLAAGLLAMTLATRSKGGVAATAVGGAGYLVLRWWGPALRRHWRVTLLACWVAILVTAAAVISVGAFRGGLPGSSLGFRWQYWTVTKQVIADHLWTGVGALNFDAAYLLRKPIDFPEEIKDPHNFVLSVLAQWGLVGGLGLLLAMAGYSWVLARTWGHGQSAPSASRERSPLQWIVVIAGLFLALRLWIMREYLFSADPAGRALVMFDLGSFGLLWLLVFGLSVWAVTTPPATGRAALACFCGCAAFLLHNTIEFSLFYPGTLTPFVALAAAVLAMQPDTPDARTGNPRIVSGLLGASLACSIVFAAFVLVPVTRSTGWLALARASSEDQPEAADRYYAAAAQADDLDPSPWVERAVLRARQGPLQDLNQATLLVDGALARAPGELSLYHLRSRIFEARFRAEESPVDMLAAIGAMEESLRLYPQSPDEHLGLADLLGRLAAETHSPELAADAIDHYREALRLNAARPGTDEVRRWSPAYCARIESHIRALEKLTDGSTSAPASLPG